jgi:glycosyltransferase involved in cell wall biosynthesis
MKHQKLNDRDERAEATRWVRRIYGQKILGDKNLPGLLEYGNTTLWWYLDLPLYYAILNYLRRSHQFTVTPPKFVARFSTAGKLWIVNCAGLSYLLIKTFIRFVYGIVSSKTTQANQSKEAQSTALVVSNSPSWRKSVIQGKTSKKDEYVGDVIKELLVRDVNVIACEICDHFPTFGIKQLIEKNAIPNERWGPVEAYLTPRMVQAALRSWVYYRTIWNKVKKTREFKELFNDELVNAYSEFESVFERFFGFNLLAAILQILMIEQAVKKEGAHVIFTHCDLCVFGRSAIIAGMRSNVPVASVISSPHVSGSREYMYTKDEIADFPTVVRLVGGVHDYDLLTKASCFPPSSVVITGQPRYDKLYLTNDYSKEAFIKRNNLDENSKLILYTAQPVGLEMPKIGRDLTMQALVGVAKKLSGVSIIVKPHPREKNEKYFSKFRASDVPLCVLSRSSDTYEAINACDVLVTMSSTTALEAMIMDKPVILMDPTNDQLSLPYIDYGAAMGARTQRDLAEAIEKILKDSTVREALRAGRRRLVFELAYIQDGRAVERIVDVIFQLINGQSKKSGDN